MLVPAGYDNTKPISVSATYNKFTPSTRYSITKTGRVIVASIHGSATSNISAEEKIITLSNIKILNSYLAVGQAGSDVITFTARMDNGNAIIQTNSAVASGVIFRGEIVMISDE